MEIIVRSVKNATIVDLHGRLDMTARWEFKAIMKQCCLTEPEHLIINLSGLNNLDSAGLGFLILAYIQFNDMNRRMSWVNPTGRVQTILQDLRVQDMVPIFGTEREALTNAT